MSIILTTPMVGGNSVRNDRNTYQIAPNGSQVVGSVDMNDVIVVKWLICVRDLTNNQTMAYEVLATHNDSTPSHNKSNVVGDVISVSESVSTMGSYVTIELTNLHDEVIEVRIQNLTMQR